MKRGWFSYLSRSTVISLWPERWQTETHWQLPSSHHITSQPWNIHTYTPSTSLTFIFTQPLYITISRQSTIDVCVYWDLHLALKLTVISWNTDTYYRSNQEDFTQTLKESKEKCWGGQQESHNIPYIKCVIMKYVNTPVWQLHRPVTDFEEQTQTNSNNPSNKTYGIQQQGQLIITSHLYSPQI